MDTFEFAARYKVGRYDIVPLLDDHVPIGLDWLPEAASPEGQRLFASAGLPSTGPAIIPVKAFVIQAGQDVVMVDSGWGTIMGPELGKVPEALALVGLAAQDIRTLFLTHLHPDHVGGLLDGSGGARFMNAKVFVQQVEISYWSDPANRVGKSAEELSFFDTACLVLKVYEGRIHAVTGGHELAPGIHAMPLPGHTPGHSGVMVQDGGERLLLWTDIVHSALLQLAHPEWKLKIDVDQGLAIKTRTRLLERLAIDGTHVMGAHREGTGRIETLAPGFKLVPN